MTESLKAALVGLALIGASGPTLAQQPVDPDWPCIQRKVEHLSIGVMWPHPLADEATPLPEDLADVAAQLALRRVSQDDVIALVEEVASRHPDLGLDGYGRLFQATFDHIDRQRSDIVAGIGRYARNQARLAAEVDRYEGEMARLEAAEEPDFDRMDEIEEQLDWRIRIFNDRNKALTYVCESPVLLEQRAYAIAQVILAAAG